MQLFKEFTKIAPNRVFLSIVLGSIAGVSYSLLVPVIVNSLSIATDGIGFLNDKNDEILGFEVSNMKIATFFLVTCLVILFSRTLSQIILVRISMDLTTELRKRIYERIMHTPLVSLEKTGSAKLLATITTDVIRIVTGARIFPDVIMNGVTVLGMLGFLWIVNDNVFYFVLQIIGFGIITYQIPMIYGNRFFSKSRASVDELHESIRGLIFGAKELRVNKSKSEEYFNEVLLKTEHEIISNDKTGHSITTSAINYGDLISFYVIGFIAFVFINYQAVNLEELIAVIMALLYISTPIGIVVNYLPEVLVANISLKKVKVLLSEMPRESIVDVIKPVPAWKTVKFEQVTYQYGKKEQEGFTLGPLGFEVNRGEITFIVGGNGSGKSTLSKLLTLFYIPTSGTILFSGIPITPENIASYRQEIAVVFSDYYLFKQLLGKDWLGKELQIQELLKDLHLDKKVTIIKGEFSTIDLSDGQRRRLALLVSLLDDKNLYLFDEWAADQDPVFKEVFYYKILPELKAQNKAIVVISHDDRYFHIADKMLTMEQGALLESVS